MRHLRAPGEPGLEQFCHLEYTSNGILVRYRDPIKRKVRVPSPIRGMDMSYISMILEIIAAQTGGDDWDEAKKEARKERMKKSLAEAKLPTEDRFEEVWMLDDKTIFCPSLADIPAAIKVAHDAFVGILELQRSGENFASGYMLGGLA